MTSRRRLLAFICSFRSQCYITRFDAIYRTSSDLTNYRDIIIVAVKESGGLCGFFRRISSHVWIPVLQAAEGKDMKILGLDIGTTTISAVVMENGAVLKSVTKDNGAFLTDCRPWEKLQDPGIIREKLLQTVTELFAAYPDIERIGITGQMHGIVYLDRSGHAVSPLYIWQDGRGDQPFAEEGMTYAEKLAGLTGYPVSTGYGLVTHFYNMHNHLVPENAVVFCTIHDYIAMVLCGEKTPVTDASDAASLGLFDVENGRFDEAALQKAGIDPAMLPAPAKTQKIGSYQKKAEVYVAIGDNQASFLGAVGGRKRCMLVNVGTGSQFSVYTEKYMVCPGLETRPFPGGGYLLAGASLCGGRAYALLEQFFRKTVQMAGSFEGKDCYDAMAALLGSSEKPENLPEVIPLFQGTRQNPQLRGSIQNLDTENFTPLHLIWGMMQGMAQELYRMYECYRNAGGQQAELIGSGNGLRKNLYLQKCFEEVFKLPLIMSESREEAACGAAVFAAGRCAEETSAV